jgi:hypothetical protein
VIELVAVEAGMHGLAEACHWLCLQHQDQTKGQWALACSGMEWAVWELRRGDGSGRAAAQPIPMKR